MCLCVCVCGCGAFFFFFGVRFGFLYCTVILFIFFLFVQICCYFLLQLKHVHISIWCLAKWSTETVKIQQQWTIWNRKTDILHGNGVVRNGNLTFRLACRNLAAVVVAAVMYCCKNSSANPFQWTNNKVYKWFERLELAEVCASIWLFYIPNITLADNIAAYYHTYVSKCLM